MCGIYFLQVGESVALEKAHKKAEDPLYALEHNLAIDAHHYRELRLSQPLLRALKLILGEKKKPRVC
jgi:DNA polymerase elongation subunit (family B)